MSSKIFLMMSLLIAMPSLGTLIIPKAELKKGDILQWKDDAVTRIPKNKGIGSFGTVYQGTWRGVPVAIKAFHMRSLPSHLASEFDFYHKASHPNIVDFYGICDSPGHFMMVSELMPMDLAEYIHKDAGHVPNMKFIAKVALDIARGLEYLHSHNVGHKHLKSRNVFLTENLEAKISDYGLSKIKLESSSNGAAAGEATVRWRAPETFTREYAKVKDNPEEQKRADIYSFGLLLWEMYAGKKPYDNKSETEVVQALTIAEREHMDATWPPALKELIQKCWAFVPASRPTIAQIIYEIETKLIPFAEEAPATGWALSLHKGDQKHLLWKGKSSAALEGQAIYSPKPMNLSFYKVVPLK